MKKQNKTKKLRSDVYDYESRISHHHELGIQIERILFVSSGLITLCCRAFMTHYRITHLFLINRIQSSNTLTLQ